MTVKFWSLIHLIDQSALSERNEKAALAPLRAALAELEQTELEDFEEQLAQALYRLDGEVYANHAGRAGASDDNFMYLRTFVVARGKEFYDDVQADPSKMPKLMKERCPALLHIVADAWEASHDEDWEFEPSVSPETGSNAKLWDDGSDSKTGWKPRSDEEIFNEPVLKRATARAGFALKNKNYSAVVHLLTQHEANLSPEEKAMLDEARRELGA